MILAKMEFHRIGTILPPAYIDETLQVAYELDDELYGPKKKRKQMVSVLKMHNKAPSQEQCSRSIKNRRERCRRRAESTASVITCSPETISLADNIDMEGFYEISVDSSHAGVSDCESFSSSNAQDNVDIMLSSCSGDSTAEHMPLQCTDLALFSATDMERLCKILPDDAHIDVSGSCSPSSTPGSDSMSSTTLSDIETEAEITPFNLDSLQATEAFADLNTFSLNGCLLTDIPLHKDLIEEPVTPLFGSEAMKREMMWGSDVDHLYDMIKEEPLDDHLYDLLPKGDDCKDIMNGGSVIKSETFWSDCFSKSDITGIAGIFDQDNNNGMLSKPAKSEVQRPIKRKSVDHMDGPSTPCRRKVYSSSDSSDRDTTRSQSMTWRARKEMAKKEAVNRVRRGPGRPRKGREVRRGPGRPRKKSVSDAVAWYQSRRKRTVSFSSKSRNNSISPARCGRTSSVSPVPRKGKASEGGKGKRSPLKTVGHHGRSRHGVQDDSSYVWYRNSKPSNRLNAHQMCGRSPLTVMSCETDDVVDVVTVNDSVASDSLLEMYDVASMDELLRHISLMHSYHSLHPVMNRSVSRHSSSAHHESSSKFSINLSVSPKTVVQQRPLTKSQNRHTKRLTAEQRAKRESLNDQERQRRCDLARATTALRAAVPVVRDNARAAKITILESAVLHIRALEKHYKNGEVTLAAERERCASLKKRLSLLTCSD